MVVAGLAVVWWQRAVLSAYGTGASFVESGVLPALLGHRDAGLDHTVVVHLADSLADCVGRSPDSSLSEALGRRLHGAGGAPVELLPVTHNAFRPTQWYYLLDDVLAVRPRLAVIGLNLRAFSEAFVASEPFLFRSLSRRASGLRTLAAADELAAQGVSILDPSIYRFEDRWGLLYVATGLREFARVRLVAAGDWIRWHLGLNLPGKSFVSHGTLTAAGARTEYDVDQAHHREARLLRRVLTDLRAGGVRILVYVSPVNVDRLAALGLREELDLPRRLEDLRQAVGAAPEEWLDLHAAAAADDFWDALNHMRPSGCTLVADALARRLNPVPLGRADAGR